MSDNRSRHDRLAVRLSLIISRLMAGESLSLKTLSDEFGVTERTLQRDFHQRLVHLDLEYRNGRYSLRRQSSPIPEMLSFIQNTGIARILPLRNGRLITCLTDNQEPSPCLIWLPAPDITATFPECFSQLILAIRQCIHISLMTERWYPSLEPCRLIYSLTSERFERRGHIHSLVAEERFISALPHFSFIHKLINTFNL
ncbi:HTH domain-containing protein [Escherichia coli]|uniref:HTH domain-containing protein n=1 Tax=Escherichia coli TaxID=562 RepID=UPI0028831AF6|nr:HTH domain-containing protein [Escherichia coli]